MKINLTHYEQVNIYNESGVIFSTMRGGFERATINGEKCVTSYRDTVTDIELNAGHIRHARKLTYDRKDIFDITYYPEHRYNVRNGKALYIHTQYINVEIMGEYLSMSGNGEKNYLTLYKLTFANAQTVQESRYERIVCDNYTLLPGETFGGGMGRDKEHAVISTFDTSESALRTRKNIPAEKGIIKHYLENVRYSDFVVKSDYYTRTEKDAARVEREKIAEIMNTCLHGKTISHYDVEKMLEKLNISTK